MPVYERSGLGEAGKLRALAIRGAVAERYKKLYLWSDITIELSGPERAERVDPSTLSNGDGFRVDAEQDRSIEGLVLSIPKDPLQQDVSGCY